MDNLPARQLADELIVIARQFFDRSAAVCAKYERRTVLDALKVLDDRPKDDARDTVAAYTGIAEFLGGSIPEGY